VHAVLSADGQIEFVLGDINPDAHVVLSDVPIVLLCHARPILADASGCDDTTLATVRVEHEKDERGSSDLAVLLTEVRTISRPAAAVPMNAGTPAATFYRKHSPRGSHHQIQGPALPDEPMP